MVTQLRSTLSYTHYGLMTTFVHRTKPGVGIEGSGVAEAGPLGLKSPEERPIFYNYRLRGIHAHPARRRRGCQLSAGRLRDAGDPAAARESGDRYDDDEGQGSDRGRDRDGGEVTSFGGKR